MFELKNFEEISEIKRESCLDIGSTIWDSYISSKISKYKPDHFANYFQEGNPALLRAIEKLLGKPLLQDVYYVKAKLADNTQEDTVVSELLVASIWPGHIHVADVEFSNPYRPIARGTGLEFQKFKGLGLMTGLLDNLTAYAKELDLFAITLTAATRSHFDFFSNFGFVITNTFAGAASLKYGAGFPMVLKVKHN